MTKLIEKIWNENLELSSNLGVTNQKLRNSEKLMFRNREKLEEKLDEKQKELYEKFNDSLDEVNYQNSQEAFCVGFSIGLRIATEALLKSEIISNLE